MSSPTNTNTTICNLALSYLKTKSIASLTEASEAARKCSQFYDSARRAALRACDYSFTRKDAALALIGSVDDPDFDATFLTLQDVVPGWAYLYAYPAKCQRVRKLYTPQNRRTDTLLYLYDFPRHSSPSPEGVQYEILRSPKTDVMAIASNLRDAWVQYTFDVTDESQFDDMFIEGFSLELALKLCMPITADINLLKVVKALRDEFIGEAKRKSLGESTEQQSRTSNYEAARD